MRFVLFLFMGIFAFSGIQNSQAADCATTAECAAVAVRVAKDAQDAVAALKSQIDGLKSKSINRCQICFRETEGSDQCQGSRNSCSDWATVGQSDPKWTAPFRDDTDNRSGGCTYQWRLVCE